MLDKWQLAITRAALLARPIPGAPGYYATSAGEVLSSTRSRRVPAAVRALKPGFTGRAQYGRVVLVVDGKHLTRLVHRLVAAAFHGPQPFAGAEVRHLDGDPRNNRASNLAWGSKAENMLDMIRHGRSQRGSRATFAKIDEETARAIMVRLDAGEDCRAVAEQMGLARSLVDHIKSGRSWSHLRDGGLRHAV